MQWGAPCWAKPTWDILMSVPFLNLHLLSPGYWVSGGNGDSLDTKVILNADGSDLERVFSGPRGLYETEGLHSTR